MPRDFSEFASSVRALPPFVKHLASTDIFPLVAALLPNDKHEGHRIRWLSLYRRSRATGTFCWRLLKPPHDFEVWSFRSRIFVRRTLQAYKTVGSAAFCNNSGHADFR